MATARAGYTATRLADGKVLVVGGANSASLALAGAERHDPSTGGWTSTGSMASGE